MRDAASDPDALESLERLRAQRSRLADRMRPTWWYLTGITVVYALVFSVPFAQRFLGLTIWPTFAIVMAVAVPLQWRWNQATGIRVGFRNLRYPAAGRPTRIAIFVVTLAAFWGERLLIDRGLTLAAVAICVFAVAAEVALQLAQLRGLRQELRTGGEAA